MEIVLKLSATPELLSRIDAITDAINSLAGVKKTAASETDETAIAPEKPKRAVRQVAKVQEPAREQAQEPEPAGQKSEPDAPSATPVEPSGEANTTALETIRARAGEIAQTGKRAQVKALVAEYAANLTEIPTDKYDEFLARLEAL